MGVLMGNGVLLAVGYISIEKSQTKPRSASVNLLPVAVVVKKKPEFCQTWYKHYVFDLFI